MAWMTLTLDGLALCQIVPLLGHDLLICLPWEDCTITMIPFHFLQTLLVMWISDLTSHLLRIMKKNVQGSRVFERFTAPVTGVPTFSLKTSPHYIYQILFHPSMLIQIIINIQHMIISFRTVSYTKTRAIISFSSQKLSSRKIVMCIQTDVSKTTRLGASI